MIRVAIGLGILLATATPSVAMERDKFCGYLRDFISAPYADESYHSVAIVWHPGGILGTLTCLHGGHSAGKALCHWLIDNTSREFPKFLPLDILKCYGLRSTSPRSSYGEWNGDLTFSAGQSRSLFMEVAIPLNGTDGGDAIRLTASSDNLASPELPPLGEVYRDVDKSGSEK